jgi:hypothetical protein
LPEFQRASPHGFFQTASYSAGTQPHYFFCFGRVPLCLNFRTSPLPQEHGRITFSASVGCRFAGISEPPHGFFQTASYFARTRRITSYTLTAAVRCNLWLFNGSLIPDFHFNKS